MPRLQTKAEQAKRFKISKFDWSNLPSLTYLALIDYRELARLTYLVWVV